MPYKDPEKQRKSTLDSVRKYRQKRKNLKKIISHWSEYSLRKWCEESKQGDRILVGIFNIDNSENINVVTLPFGLDFFLNLLKQNECPFNVSLLQNYFVLENVGSQEPKELIFDIHTEYEKIKDRDFKLSEEQLKGFETQTKKILKEKLE